MKKLLFSFAILSLWAPGWWLGMYMARAFGSVDSAPWSLKVPLLILVVLPPTVLVLGHDAIMKASDVIRNESGQPLHGGQGALNTERPASVEDNSFRLTFSSMGGVGKLVCEECGYCEQIVSYLHGHNNETLGFQCESCGQFDTRSFCTGEPKSQQTCVHCEGLLLRDRWVFCPSCRGFEVIWEIEYIS